MRRVCIALGACAVALLAGPSGASAATGATCTASTPPLKIVVDRDSGASRRRAISLANNGGTRATATKPLNLIITRGGRTRTVTFDSLQGEYRYTARRNETVGVVAMYAEDSSGYGAVRYGTQGITQVDLAGLAGTLTSLLSTLHLPPIATNVINVLLPVPTTFGAFGSELCVRTQAASVSESATASASKMRVRRANRPRRRAH